MAFLSPLWLLAALAAAVPLAIHLLRRRTGAPIDFPAVRWLQRAEREHSRSLRLRNLLLMLLRVGAVLLFALAAAQPMAPLPGAGH
ncbi:MAG TPA: BatA domain-containing protein, partial [Gemmatimonadaceae bacterium]|nr:BatA domain-containing protein [Gemmatimonadaceae bacterium]